MSSDLKYFYRSSNGIESGPLSLEQLIELEKIGVILSSTTIIDGDSRSPYASFLLQFNQLASANPDASEAQEPEIQEIQHHSNGGRLASPIRRYLARAIDYWVALLVVYNLPSISETPSHFYVVLSVMSKHYPVFTLVIVAIFSAVPMVTLNSVLISRTGASFGKAIFGMKVCTSDGEYLTFRLALSRELLVVYYGMAFGMPILNTFANFLRYRQVKEKGVTRWDEVLKTNCIRTGRQFF